MWLFATSGFFSIVEHKDDPDYLLVRARVKGDIENYWPHAEVQKTEDADYLYRAKISRFEVADAIMNMVKNITYTSYKGALDDFSRYTRWYSHVSQIMQDMQEEMDASNSD